MNMSLMQLQYLSTAGKIYLDLLDETDATDAVKAEAFADISAIISQGKRAGFDDATIAAATRLPIFLVAGVA